MSEEQNQDGQSQQTDSQQTDFTVPEAYAGKEWAKNIKSSDDLWGQFANAQTLIGKRGIPSADAPDEEWDKFYAATGRPEKPEYDLPDVDGLPEGVDLAPYKQKAMPIFHAAWLNQKQAERAWKAYIEAEMQYANESKSKIEGSQKELDAQFDEMAKSAFGDNFDKASETAQKFLNENVDEKLRVVIASADPKTQLAIISAVNASQTKMAELKKQYGAEGDIASGDGKASGSSIEETRKELAELRTSAAAKDFLHKDHKKTMERIQELSGAVGRHYKSA